MCTADGARVRVLHRGLWFRRYMEWERVPDGQRRGGVRGWPYSRRTSMILTVWNCSAARYTTVSGNPGTG